MIDLKNISNTFNSHAFSSSFSLVGSVQHVPISDGQLEDIISQPNLNPVPDVVIGIDSIFTKTKKKKTKGRELRKLYCFFTLQRYTSIQHSKKHFLICNLLGNIVY